MARTLVIGDSLGVGTTPFLRRRLGNVEADAKVGRSSASGVKALRRKGGNYETVVFDLGTNDGDARQLARSVRKAKRLAPNARIVIPTVNGPGAAEKNAALRRLAGGRVELVDWASRSRGKTSDGVHGGYRSRAKLIADAVDSQPSMRDRAYSQPSSERKRLLAQYLLSQMGA